MKYELRSIKIGSLILSGVPALLFFLGLFGGVMTFVVLPSNQLGDLSASQRVMAAAMFSLLYMFLMVALLIVVAFLYNFFTQTVGLRGLCVELSEAQEGGADEAAEEEEGQA
jgi:hypothetical protein